MDEPIMCYSALQGFYTAGSICRQRTLGTEMEHQHNPIHWNAGQYCQWCTTIWSPQLN